ncbi:MAG: SDR family oxidoreductase [Hyphomicrobiales bacterium]|nr:MAG: SDR family oxidoreductase [Hyphomicrobiales bacterium]
MKLFCFGLGYSAQELARKLSGRADHVVGTHTGSAGAPMRGLTLVTYRGDGPSQDVRAHLDGVTHVLVSIPPDLEGDIVLRQHGLDLAQLPSLEWVGYLSTIGVYGDAKGTWIDETHALRPKSERSLRRVHTENAWLKFADETGKRVEIFRLSGIYGPGRSVIDNLRAGTARRIVKSGQVFNRIHVEDIARVVAKAIDTPTEHRIYNVTDDEPAPPEDVMVFAAGLLGIEPPPAIPFEQAELSPMAASFWAENKRVRNDRIRNVLRADLLYPTYREGLQAILND